jgi:hypothetical protein
MDENEKKLNDKKDVKVLRTYTSDMVDAIRTNEISVIKIALAEKEKRDQQELYKKAEGTGFTKTLLIIGGIIFIVAAIFGSSYLIQMKKIKDTPKPTINNIETFISYDSKLYIDATNITNVTDLSNTIKKEQQADSGMVEALFLTNTVNSVPGILISKNFLSVINSTAPGALTRSLSDKYLLGEYSSPNSNMPAMFLIFETTDYNQAYASMLEWEKTMLGDLYVLFNINIPDSQSPLFEKPWKDIVVNNKDARVLYDENGAGILYYVFVNKNDFVITNNVDALKEVINRLIIKNAKPQ